MTERNFYYMLRAGDDDLVERYARAREIQADRMAEEIIEIADDATNDFMEKRASPPNQWGVAHDNLMPWSLAPPRRERRGSYWACC